MKAPLQAQFASLADVCSYVVEDGGLFLSLQMDGGIMRFAQAAE